MKNYEMLCVLPGTLAEDEVLSVVDAVKQEVGKYEAAQVTIENLGKSKLAYPIKHIRYGYFQLFHFELEEDKLKVLHRGVRMIDNVLRAVIKIYDPKKVGSYTLAQDPTALSAPRQDRKFGSQDKRPAVSGRIMQKPEEKDKKVIEDKKDEEIGIKDEEKKESEAPKVARKPKTRISLDDIDQKLDEILQEDIDKV